MDFDYNLHVFTSPDFQSVVMEAIDFFAQTPVHSLPPPKQLLGPGVYGLYYTGDYELYAAIAKLNQDAYTQPIYIGKAVPPGARTGRILRSDALDLYLRLAEHARSIQQGAKLGVEDFTCRFMVLNNIERDLIVPVESALIRKYAPLWNVFVSGFGNHDPGSGRYKQARSEWDVLHPGRLWAENLTGGAPSLEEVIAKVRFVLAESLFP
ncbi:MAG: Eco29kI family restriction endonuclease [Chloroflexota bacterium]|nr:Eco29kI family restriction endonuclease [Chloroflexota bacterium]